MRTLPATALLLLACGFAGGCADSSSRPSGAGATSTIPGGPDPIVLRVPRAGGTMVAYGYPALDSALWRSSGRVPPLDRVIAFGAEDGYLAAVGDDGAPVRLDLRLGTVSIAKGSSLHSVTSADGADIYALTAAGELTRFTPSGGDWKFTPPFPAHAIHAQGDGSVIVTSATGTRVLVWRVRPPGQGVSDSVGIAAEGDPALIARSIGATSGVTGDRVFFGANEALMAVRSRDLTKALEVDLGAVVSAIAATPSGDRMFVALADDDRLSIVDRFEEGVSGRIALPSPVRELRMDPLGRTLLARGAGDTVFVISLASDALQGVVRSEWRGDLPQTLPDGAIATVQGNDVVLADAATLAEGRRIAGGARDFWHVLRWNGFRPRAAGLDQPVEFRRSAPRDPADTAPVTDSTRPPLPPGTTAPPPPPPPPVQRDSVFTVSFAAILDEGAAKSLANRIRVDGQRPRVVGTDRGGTTLYRVVLGPYATRAEAERVGRASGQSYWVFEGNP